jgi:hypothetical protein
VSSHEFRYCTCAWRFSPDGELRVAIKLGNPVLVQRDETSGNLEGVFVALENALAKELDDHDQADSSQQHDGRVALLEAY